MTERKRDRYRGGNEPPSSGGGYAGSNQVPDDATTDPETETPADREAERRRGMGVRALPVLGAIGVALAWIFRRKR